MDLGVQRLQATIHHFREAGHRRHVRHLQARAGDGLGGPSSGNQFNTAVGQRLREIQQTRLVGNRNERPAHLPET